MAKRQVTRISSDKAMTLQIEKHLSLPKNAKKIGNNAAQALRKTLVPKIEKQVGERYLHAIEAIGGILKDPQVSTFNTSSAKHVRYSRFGSKSRKGRFQTERWKALNKRYAARDPRSKTFWRKGRNPAGNDTEYVQLANLYAMAVKAVGRPVQRGASDAIVTDPGRARIRIVLYLTKLPVPLNRLVASAFLRARARTALTHRLTGSAANGARNTIRRIAWVEGTRPLVSGVAAKLGEQMIADLRKLNK
jgi:hypothetical protein